MDMANIHQILSDIYPKSQTPEVLKHIERLLLDYPGRDTRSKGFLTEQDVILITYGDQFQKAGEKPLVTLGKTARQFFQEHITGIHILPFYPYSSDDGFSVIDYQAVDPRLGNWEDIEPLSQSFDLMFDAVINHISAKSGWFQGYLSGDPNYSDYFIEADPNGDYSKVVRPRALPLLTRFETTGGPKWLWTTFSPDQIDLNYRSISVLTRIIELLLFYVRKGARLIRLDACGFLWKDIGTSCIHLPQTHRIIQLFRSILDMAAPGTILVTETNVPHKDNVSYFGDGTNEAHMVYQFSLPPLVLHTFHTGNARKLTAWAESIQNPSDRATFFNFLASHDGIGLLPAAGILSPEEVDNLVQKALDHRGLVSYRANGDGTKSPYELNINYLNALSHPLESTALKVKRMTAAHSILLTFLGVPGIYVHSLLGSENDWEGARTSGINRRINREKLSAVKVEEELKTDGSLRNLVFSSLTRLINLRRKEKAFNPFAPQRILAVHENVFANLRGEGSDAVLCLHNVSNQTLRVSCRLGYADFSQVLVDLVTGTEYQVEDDRIDVLLQPYQFLWLKGR